MKRILPILCAAALTASAATAKKDRTLMGLLCLEK